MALGTYTVLNVILILKMIITIDGPKGSGKTELARNLFLKLNFSAVDEETLEDNTTVLINESNIELEPIKALNQIVGLANQSIVTVVDSGVLDKIAQSQLDEDQESFMDRFLAGFQLSRIIQGRGLEIIIMPEDASQLVGLGSKSPAVEYNWYRRNSFITNPKIVINSYNHNQLDKIAKGICMEVLTKSHPSHLTIQNYVGPTNPDIVFVDCRDGFSTNGYVPFSDLESVKMFRNFSAYAYRSFGYTKHGSIEKLGENLTAKLVTVGEEGFELLPDLPNVTFGGGPGHRKSVKIFKEDVQQCIEIFEAEEA